jgi:hypothetical protein
VARFKRWNIKAILADPVLRKELMVRSIISTQALEGITTTVEQAEQAYDKVRAERENQ